MQIKTTDGAIFIPSRKCPTFVLLPQSCESNILHLPLSRRNQTEINDIVIETDHLAMDINIESNGSPCLTRKEATTRLFGIHARVSDHSPSNRLVVSGSGLVFGLQLRAGPRAGSAGFG